MVQGQFAQPVAARRDAPVPLPRGLRLRLTVAIPLVVTFLVMLSGFLALWISYPLFFQATRPASAEVVEQRVMWALLAVAGFTLLSLAVAVALARSIAGPLRALASRIDSLRHPAGEVPLASGQVTEIGALGSALEGAESSFSGLMLDSYILRSLEGGVVTASQDGIVTSYNPVAEKILGTPALEALGGPAARILGAEPANRGFLAAVREALAGGPRVSSAEATITARGGASVHLGYSISPLRGEAGRLLGIVLTFKDLAEQKYAEQIMLRAENLALLGTMATGVAHEIRNPLGAMNGLVELIRDALAPGSPQCRYCDKMLESIDRINRICQELLTVGHPEPRDVEPLDINELVRSTLELLRYDAANRDVEVREDYAPDLPPVPGDGERLGQVILNILRNGFQAVRDGGHIELATSRADGLVAVAVRNTGPPIPEEVQKRLFSLFFTTKKRGTGLGLAISQQLVRAHGGRILVDSGPERGTTFTVEIPIVCPEPAAVGAP